MCQPIQFITSNNLIDNVPKNAKQLLINNDVNKQVLLASLADACNFPSYFANNWDSAWDCLTDSEVKDLMLDLTTADNINTEDFTMFKRMIEDAFHDFGKPRLWILVGNY